MGRKDKYSKEVKINIVKRYRNGEDSYLELASKYKIPSHEFVRRWVSDYNRHIELKDYIPRGEVIYMTKSRKVTKEEHIEIVRYCIEHDCDYKTTAKLYETTYANVLTE